MQKLAIVVTCSERKSHAVVPELRVRALPAAPVAARVATWQERLSASTAGGRLWDLYSGQHWARAKALVRSAASAGFEPDLWVASAGLGLQSVDSHAPAYGATFATGHPDSVATRNCSGSEWWTELQRVRGTSLRDLAAHGSLLILLSECYGRALRDELRAVAELDTDAVLVGGADDLPGLHRVLADRRLRSALGGALTSLHTRIAAAWLERLEGNFLAAPEAKRGWERWAEEVAREERYSRSPISDDDVREFIRACLKTHPRPSCTSALRRLRDADMACEQRRFTGLYAQVLGEQ